MFFQQDWAFLTRFCYKDSVGELKYHFEYPVVSIGLLSNLALIPKVASFSLRVSLLSFALTLRSGQYIHSKTTCTGYLEEFNVR